MASARRPTYSKAPSMLSNGAPSRAGPGRPSSHAPARRPRPAPSRATSRGENCGTDGDHQGGRFGLDGDWSGCNARRSQGIFRGVPRAPGEPDPSEVTPLHLYLRRREFLALGAGAAAAWAHGGAVDAAGQAGPLLPGVKKGPFATDETQTPYADVTTYNNYYEFGTDKGDPAANAGSFRTRPWTVTFEGEIKNPQTVVDRRSPDVVSPRGAHLSHAVRRGLVDGDSLGGSARSGTSCAGSSPRPRRSTSPSPVSWPLTR